ncbi:hypothetical protein, partial [Bradyrhizobium sp.]|uniref:hypothetical protein n=1 Tax=Bradyrhizobium sp. TaxID=376 RepID=UPI0023912860
MPVFAIIPQPNPNTPKLGDLIASKFPGEHTVLDGSAGWLVSAKSTAQEISANLGITSGEHGAAIIVEVASYFGRANPNIWSWLKIKLEAP